MPSAGISEVTGCAVPQVPAVTSATLAKSSHALSTTAGVPGSRIETCSGWLEYAV
jgi:hypothetical protein